MTNPRLSDNDAGEITVALDGRELRGWSYKDDNERRAKMFAAREYVEGWCDAIEARAVSVTSPVRPCPGCDGHECDSGCAYPGAVSRPLRGGE